MNRATKKKQNFQIERDMSVDIGSLSLTAEIDKTKDYDLKKLVELLLKNSKKINKIYKKNSDLLFKNSFLNKHFGNNISRAIRDMNDSIKYIDNFKKKGKIIEYDSNKKKTKKKVII